MDDLWILPMDPRAMVQRWELLPTTTHSGKVLSRCRKCGRVTPLPDKKCSESSRCETWTMTSWKDFPWPSWVPTPTRLIMEFRWSEGPAAWAADAIDNRAPLIGELVSLPDDEGKYHVGRYFHVKGRTGRVVMEDDKTWACINVTEEARHQYQEGAAG
jgi:uncharacterized OB-fold protein